MPSEDAIKFDFSIYVEPEYVGDFKKLIDTSSSERNNIPLGMEAVIGLYIDCERRGVASAVLVNSFGNAMPDHGAGVAEVYPEDER